MLDEMNDWRELKTMVKALADVARLTIVYHLARQEEVTVTALTDLLKISQPLVSWHLRKLRRAGLMRTRRAGRQVYCSLDKERFQYCLQRLGHLIDPTIVIGLLPIGASLIEAEAVLEE
ncbi:MAG: metalloregulator ArsR/SmtB family transcription factor [Ktedonobacteraceae bacterium]|nr:metalloregulator ArsR/SmtB family transcription factor [Chloroflexota bacterium]